VWRGGIHDLVTVRVEKNVLDPRLEPEEQRGLPPEEIYAPLPPSIVGMIGPDAEEYQSFFVSHLTQAEADRLHAAARATGVRVIRGASRSIGLPFHEFEAGDQSTRHLEWSETSLSPSPVPGFLILQFGYPVKEEWHGLLAGCGVETIGWLGSLSVLVRAELDEVMTCSVAQYLSWAGHYYTTDRLHPAAVTGETAPRYRLAFAPGITLEQVRAQLPPPARVIEANGNSQTGIRVKVEIGRARLLGVIAASHHLLRVETEPEMTLSDEVQAQVLTGLHPATGYLSWLSAKGLRTASNQQRVAVFDSGIDYDGFGGNLFADHPAIGGRLYRAETLVKSGSDEETIGHGTLVASVAVGRFDGTGGEMGEDKEGFDYATGIAPDAELVAVKVHHEDYTNSCAFEGITTQTDILQDAFEFARTTGGALVSNHSWNLGSIAYGQVPRYFDGWVRDADDTVPGAQPMTIVVSAGNVANDPTITRVLQPANAKSVIGVGATENVRPWDSDPGDMEMCDNGVDFTWPDDNPDDPDVVPDFSARGDFFSVPPNAGVHATRVRPDLVAPGWRVFGAVPPDNPPHYACWSLCHQYREDEDDPLPSDFMRYTWGRGTSFAAPAVAGAAALKIKWFRDQWGCTPTNPCEPWKPSPSLVKASLVATAESLGGQQSCSPDCRPSRDYGWGQLNLDRLFDDEKRFYVTADPALRLGVGASYTWSRLLADHTKDTYIVLAWSDNVRHDDTFATSNPKNDLDLWVGAGVACGPATQTYFRGNNFNENVNGVDDGFSAELSSSPTEFADSKNTVEAVFIPANFFSWDTPLCIRVTGVSMNEEPWPAETPSPGDVQDYALYAYNVDSLPLR